MKNETKLNVSQSEQQKLSTRNTREQEESQSLQSHARGWSALTWHSEWTAITYHTNDQGNLVDPLSGTNKQRKFRNTRVNQANKLWV